MGLLFSISLKLYLGQRLAFRLVFLEEEADFVHEL